LSQTIDLITLRHLLDLLCQLAYQEGDFILFRATQFTYINGKQVLHPQGALAIGRIFLAADRCPGSCWFDTGSPLVSAVSVVSPRAPTDTGADYS